MLSNATGESGLQIAADGIEFASLTPPTFGFAVTNESTPAQMVAGDSATVNLTLQNTSSFPWQVRGQNAVQLLYRWLDSQGKVLSTGQPVALTQDLAVNASEPVQVTVQAPTQAGTDTLQWDLIQQGTQVFSKRGASPKNDRVTVTTPAAQPQPTHTAQPTVTVHPTATAEPTATTPPSTAHSRNKHASAARSRRTPALR
jgi:hypothetical protein